jgi:UDP-glucose 4-epimerase
LSAHYEGKRVIIFGGAGFIGSTLADKLVRLGADVTIVDGLIAGTGGQRHHIEALLPAITFYAQRIEHLPELHDLLAAADLIVDAMGYTRHLEALENPQFDIEVNLLSHIHLIRACADLPGRTIIYLGSRGQYGLAQGAGSLIESACQEPIDPQGISKVAAESFLRIYTRKCRCNAVSLRATNCFGERQLYSGEDIGLVGAIVRRLLAGGRFDIFGNPSRPVNLLYVHDLVDVILRIGAADVSGFQAYNVAGQMIFVGDLLARLVKIVGSGDFHVTATPEDLLGLVAASSAVFSEQKLVGTYGPSACTDLDEALESTVAYFRQQLHEGEL